MISAPTKRSTTLSLFALAILVVSACSTKADQGRTSGSGGGGAASSTGSSGQSASTLRASLGVRVEIAYPESSAPFSSLPVVTPRGRASGHAAQTFARARGPRPGSAGLAAAADPVVQKPASGLPAMPSAGVNFAGQIDAAFIAPPDTNGAVGPNHFVQAVNVSLEIFHKNGTVAAASNSFNALWAGYVGTNPGNGCSTQNDGDPIVVYDQLADRWFLTQFSLPNTSTIGGPAFQCVAVSKTGDPTGAYWLYDFQYGYSLNDYGKFGIWPDAYYATFNVFDYNPDPNIQFDFKGDDFCAYDRAKMLAGEPATQQCILQAYPKVTPCPTDGGPPPVEPFQIAGALPVSLDGLIPPPLGSPGWFAQFDYSQCGPTYGQLDLWSFSVDWKTPSNSALTGPTQVDVASFTPTCYFTPPTAQGCIPEPGGSVLAGLDDRLMFRFTYRNFGTHESLLVNHSVAAAISGQTVTQGGVRWYELRLPSGTPTLFQQGTFVPAGTDWAWMASFAQDQAQDMALGFSLSSATHNPSIGWTGRLAGDALGTMGQAQAIIDTGTGTEAGGGRWGDYSNMTVDPVDDCTFWYTQEQYNTADWETYVANVKFPNCGANDFSLTITPPAQSLTAGGTVPYTVTTASTKGTAETLALNVEDLPPGVSGSFVPSSVTAGQSSTLTLSATGAATNGTATFMVIGKATSAVHAATAQVTVTGGCQPMTCGTACGILPDGCGGKISCGPCVSDGGTESGVGDSGVDSGADAGVDSGVDSGVDGGVDSGIDGGLDAGVDAGFDAGLDSGGAPDSGDAGGVDAGMGVDSGPPPIDAGARDAAPTADGAIDGGPPAPGDSGGCGCRTADPSTRSPSPLLALGALGLIAGVRRRRSRPSRATGVAGT